MTLFEAISLVLAIATAAGGLIVFYFSRKDRSEDRSYDLSRRLESAQDQHFQGAIARLEAMVSKYVEALAQLEKDHTQKLSEMQRVTTEHTIQIGHLIESVRNLAQTFEAIRRGWEEAEIAPDVFRVPGHAKRNKP